MTAPDTRLRRTEAGYGDRVRVVHAQSRSTIRVALLFVAGAVIAAAVPGTSTWLALHLFLAGGIGLTVSAVSQMLTVTWSSAPAPGDRIVAVQRAAVALGAAGVAVTRESGALPDWSVGVPGTLYTVGLLLLVHLLVSTARRGRERRFDVAVAFYVTALAAAVGAVGVGIVMASSGATLELRSIHVVLNLLGFVGLTVAGSLPFFAATVGRARMSSNATPLRLAILLGSMAASLLLVVVGLAIGSDGLVFSGLGGYLYGIVAVYCFLPRPDRRQLAWSGPRLVALWLGGLWWMGAVGALAHGVITTGNVALTGRWVHVLVVGGYAQILWGSLAYLIPMLRGGGHERLREGFARTRSWVGLVGIDAAATALAFGSARVAMACLAVTVLDGLWRTVHVGLRRLARPGGRYHPSGGSVEPGAV